MATNAEATLTREGLIWLLAERISSAEGKPFTYSGQQPEVERAYVLTLIRDVVQAVDGKGVSPGVGVNRP